MSMLLDNLNDVEKRIQAACDRSGRKREEVLLVAVSKTKPVEMIEEIMTAGIVDFGENKPQELRDKYEVLPKNLRFHMIGHLQTNKIKYVIDRAVLIHSIDSLRAMILWRMYFWNWRENHAETFAEETVA